MSLRTNDYVKMALRPNGYAQMSLFDCTYYVPTKYFPFQLYFSSPIATSNIT